ncbi:MAG: DNA-directed RNA polymerase subunit beta' [Candidatus Margulisiibacteriota bacterium]|jgi:DNA-directed RNA polymerase subunit beta'
MLVNSPSDFDFLEIGLASPDRIRFWSYGEIEKAETINYRTFKPERKGLFCEKIFGPVKDWECACGKYRRVRYRGIVCERCGVEVTHSKVRRERMGHIELAAEVSHIWFLKGMPSYLSILLDISSRNLEEVIYYDAYIVTEVVTKLEGILNVKQILTIQEYEDFKEKYKDSFKADIGARAIKKILQQMNLSVLVVDLKKELEDAKGQKKLKITKRLRVLESLYKSGNKPEWVILDAIPVMPPDLRPMVQLEGGRFATSDLNDLYRRVVNRNNRLKRLMDIGAPDMIVRNEKRMLQEAVDVLIANGKRGRAVTGSNGRPLKSLANIIEGKQGRFRQNLLGKRVDYSGRSVIVVGPHLKFYQCGLPKEMALELFKPFVIRKLVEEGVASNVKSAKRKIEKRDVVVWDVLEKVIKGQPVLLNRAPTLHRLGIQAFEPVLVEGSAIQIHPLVCTAFNADFDGDQMAVHVPLSLEAQSECRFLILANNNILSPSNGRSIVTPTQDMVLGCYYLTAADDENKEKERYFRDIAEAWRAWDQKVISLQSYHYVKIKGERVRTTIGRIVFNSAVWDILMENNLETSEFINENIGKKQLADLVFLWYTTYGNELAAKLADKLKEVGFKYSTLSGISISIDDLKIPKNKKQIIDDAEKEVKEIEKLEIDGAITERERRFRVNDIWRGVTQNVSDQMETEFGKLNNVFIMANSGARGNIDQVRQLAGMRGLMSDSQGNIITIPIKSNFKEGLTLTEYFISSYGARKGLVDTALRTADSGYLTRRLVDIAQDVMITEEDCGSHEGVNLQALKDGLNIIVPLSEVIEGRISLEEIADPKTNEVIINIGDLISPAQAKKAAGIGLEGIKVRSVYKCKAKRGICRKCYGVDLASSKLINLGEAVGIIAAQSIGEPGTQLTMRTFHTGGVDLRKASKVDIKAKHAGKIKFDEELTVSKIKDEKNNSIYVSTKEGNIIIETTDGEKRGYLIPKGSTVLVQKEEVVAEWQQIAVYDPTYEYIISEGEGAVKFIGLDLKKRENSKGKVIEIYAQNDGEIFVYNPKVRNEYIVEGKYAGNYTKFERIKAGTDFSSTEQLEYGALILDVEKMEKPEGKEKSKKQKDDVYKLVLSPGESYPVLSGARIYTDDGELVKEGEIIVRERTGSLDASKTKDIIQGLPRVEELFEGRKPKDSAILAEIAGKAETYDREGIRFVTITSDTGVVKEYKIPYGMRLKLYSGKYLNKGDQLTDGVLNPHDILETKGVYATQSYLDQEIQTVYRSQGVKINSKHIEVIVRQMARKVNVIDMGDSALLPNEMIDIKIFREVNEQMLREGKKPAIGERVLLGITRASLNTESFISASSFQETARVLTEAAIKGKTDEMYGLKENVIIGKLIPAGTGLSSYRKLGIKLDLSETKESGK